MYYRECKKLNGQKAYEFHKLCTCGHCTMRSRYDRGSRNQATVTTEDKGKFKEIEYFLENWTCGTAHKEPIKYYNF